MSIDNLINKLYQHDLEDHPPEDRKKDWDYDHYYGVNRSSDSILISFGESWTYGGGLRPDSYRLKNVYGAQASEQLGWDWVNCGALGFSNSWVLKNCKIVVDYLNKSNYSSGALVITFTENGRDIRDYSSRRFDYTNIYKDFPITTDFYNKVLDDVEQEWINTLEEICSLLDNRFTIVAGCNFVWQEKLAKFCSDHTRISWIDQNWIELLAIACNKDNPPRVNLTQFSAVEVLNDILKISDGTAFKQWVLQNSDSALNLMEWMINTPEFFEKHDPGHPNAQGHRVWADAITKILTLYKQG